MKKTGKKIIGIFLCGGFVLTAFLGTMAYGAAQPQLTLHDLSGEREALEGFTLTGTFVDKAQTMQTDFVLEDGELFEKTGTPHGKNRREAEAKKSPYSDLYTEKEIGTTAVMGINYDGGKDPTEVEIDADGTVQVLGHLAGTYGNQRFRTIKPKEYGDIPMGSEFHFRDGAYEDAVFLAVEPDETYFCILNTAGQLEGTADLIALKREELREAQWDEVPPSDPAACRVLKRFAVDDKNYILDLAPVGEKQFLMVRLKGGDTAVFELYNGEGKVLAEKELPFSESRYKNISIKEWRQGEQYFQELRKNGTAERIFLAAEPDRLTVLPAGKEGEFLGRNNGTVLFGRKTVPADVLGVPAFRTAGKMPALQYELSALDEKDGSLKYQGRLEAKEPNDLYKLLAAVNISKRTRPLAERGLWAEAEGESRTDFLEFTDMECPDVLQEWEFPVRHWWKERWR